MDEKQTKDYNQIWSITKTYVPKNSEAFNAIDFELTNLKINYFKLNHIDQLIENEGEIEAINAKDTDLEDLITIIRKSRLIHVLLDRKIEVLKEINANFKVCHYLIKPYLTEDAYKKVV
jgi:hypothetical protein